MATINIDLDRYFSEDDEYKEELTENKDFQRILRYWENTILSCFYMDVIAKYGVKYGQVLGALMLDFYKDDELKEGLDFWDFFIGALAEDGFQFKPWPFTFKEFTEDALKEKDKRND